MKKLLFYLAVITQLIATSAFASNQAKQSTTHPNKCIEHIQDHVFPDFYRTHELNLDNCDITDQDIPAIMNFINSHQDLNIAQLYLNNNKISDQGAALLATNTETVVNLYLSNNHLGPASAEALAKNTSARLVNIVLDGNHIGDQGAIALSERKPRLLGLGVEYNKITSQGIYALANSNQNDLFLAGNQVNAEALAPLQIKQTHSTVWLEHCQLGAKELAVLAKAADTLDFLNLSNNNIDDAGAKLIASNINIGMLILDSNNIGVDGSTAIAAMPKLSSISVADNHIRDQGAKALAANQNLFIVNLSKNNISPEGAIALATAPTLNWLNISDNPIGDTGVQALASSQSLKSIFLNNTKLTAAGASTVADKPELAQLSLDDNNLGDEGATAVATALAKNRQINTLYINHNNITDDGATALAKLHIGFLEAKDNHIGDDGAVALAMNQFIFYLDVRMNPIGVKGIDALKNNKSLIRLLVDENNHLGFKPAVRSISFNAKDRKKTYLALLMSKHPEFFNK